MIVVHAMLQLQRTLELLPCQVLLKELYEIVQVDDFLRQADLQVCTGPYILCHLLQQVLHAPLFVYSGRSLSRPCQHATNQDRSISSSTELANLLRFGSHIPGIG